MKYTYWKSLNDILYRIDKENKLEVFRLNNKWGSCSMSFDYITKYGEQLTEQQAREQFPEAFKC